MGNVMIIPAKRQVGNTSRRQEDKPKLRVAAYCRVSTDSDEQASSYETQVEHYTEYIKKNPEWEFAGIYADDGISGTNTKKREEFNRMIEACKTGEIDMIITKSISRFARNTLDCLKYIRMLKDKNIPVFFEKESINTMDAKGEVLLTIMASLAQQESQSLVDIAAVDLMQPDKRLEQYGLSRTALSDNQVGDSGSEVGGNVVQHHASVERLYDMFGSNHAMSKVTV